jgi:diguanylate cyclase (GGDEF)-like protein
MQLAEQALEGCMQSAQPFSVVLMDLDDFKAINDRFGHAGGDAVLKHVVAQFRSQLRPQDVTGRMGGEEFLIIFPHTVGSVARSVADRLRGSLSAVDGIAYSFSAGVAEARLGECLSELLKR